MHCKEDLMDMEYSELRAYFLNLPVMDMDQVWVLGTLRDWGRDVCVVCVQCT